MYAVSVSDPNSLLAVQPYPASATTEVRLRVDLTVVTPPSTDTAVEIVTELLLTTSLPPAVTALQRMEGRGAPMAAHDNITSDPVMMVWFSGGTVITAGAVLTVRLTLAVAVSCGTYATQVYVAVSSSPESQISRTDLTKVIFPSSIVSFNVNTRSSVTNGALFLSQEISGVGTPVATQVRSTVLPASISVSLEISTMVTAEGGGLGVERE